LHFFQVPNLPNSFPPFSPAPNIAFMYNLEKSICALFGANEGKEETGNLGPAGSNGQICVAPSSTTFSRDSHLLLFHLLPPIPSLLPSFHLPPFCHHGFILPNLGTFGGIGRHWLGRRPSFLCSSPFLVYLFPLLKPKSEENQQHAAAPPPPLCRTWLLLLSPTLPNC
jgi:hypothetical protein